MPSKLGILACSFLIASILFASLIIPTSVSAQAGTYTISGNAGVGGATLSYDDGGAQTATADINGDYTLIVSSGWSGTVTPSKAGYVFTPASWDYVSVASDQPSQNYTATIRKQVSTGRYHACGIKPGGELHCWGTNDYGQATPPAGIYTQVGTGDRHSCAMKPDDTVTCWGSNEYGQSSAPSGAFAQMSVGGFVNCGLRPDHTLACWGMDEDGVISNVPGGTFKQVSAGGFHVCAIKMDDTLFCWGWDDYGQISNMPVDTFAQISAGWDFACGIKLDGTLVCWGFDEYGKINPPSGVFTQVSAGGRLACARKNDDTVSCWGLDNVTQGSDAPAGSFTQVSVGESHTCAVNSSDDRWVCWGAGLMRERIMPYQISGRTGARYATLSYNDGGPQTVTAAFDGTYTLYVSDGWSGTVTVRRPQYTFNPPSRTYTNVVINKVEQNYIPTVTLTSIGAQDGWVLESKAGSKTGGSSNAAATTVFVGDDVANRQFRTILSFETSNAIPSDEFKITSAVLKLYRSAQAGSDPFIALGNLLVDMKLGPFGTNALQLQDFNALASGKKTGGIVTHVGKWYSIPLNPSWRNKLVPSIGIKQFRLYFTLPSNGNKAANWISFVSGNGSIAMRPQLVITYNPVP